MMLIVAVTDEVGGGELRVCVVLARRCMLGMMTGNRSCVEGRGVGMIVGVGRR